MSTTRRHHRSTDAADGATTWKSAMLWAMAVIVAIGAAGWLAVSCGTDRVGAERPVTEAEAAALAALRHRNHDGDPVAVRMRFPAEDAEVVVDGFLDWNDPLLYGRMPGPDGEDHLVQAVPGLVASHADDEAFDEVLVPQSAWTPRQMMAGDATEAEAKFDILISSVFTLTAETGDDPAYLAEHAAWREEGVIDGEAVDTFRAPIMVETSETTAANPEALYSLDQQGDIRRFQVNVGGSELASVEFLREVDFNASGLEPIDMLGGPSIAPSKVDDELAKTIAQVRTANWEQSATVEMTVPIADGEVAFGHGTIDWRTMTAYLNIEDADGHRLLLARPGGLASLATDSSELPASPPSEGWETHALAGASVAEHFGPVETLTYRLLEMSAEAAADTDEMAERASQLRIDEADGKTTHVVEFPVVGDAAAEPGESAFRYHITGERLSEVELMTSFGMAGAELTYEDHPMVAVPWTVSSVIG